MRAKRGDPCLPTPTRTHRKGTRSRANRLRETRASSCTRTPRTSGTARGAVQSRKEGTPIGVQEHGLAVRDLCKRLTEGQRG